MSTYDRYMREFSRINAMRMMLARQGTAMQPPGPMEIARQVASRGKRTYNYSLGPGGSPKRPENNKVGLAALLDKAPWFIAPGAKLASEALHTSPARAVLDVLSRGTYGSANATLQYNRADRSDGSQGIGLDFDALKVLPDAFWEGLKGKQKVTYSDVIRDNDPGAGNVERAGLGLAADIFADPTTYIPVAGLIGAAGKITARTSKVVKPAEIVAENLEKGAPVAEAQVPLVQKILEAGPERRAITAGREPIEVTPKIIPGEVVRTAEADTILDAVKSTETWKYPGAPDVPAPFRTIEEEVPATAAAFKTDTQKAKLARARAVKATIMQDEGYRIGKWSMSDLRKAAKSKPERAAQVERLINDEVKRVMKTGDFENLPARAQLYGRSGEKAAFGLSLDDLTDLLHRGEIGGAVKNYGQQSDEFTQKFPIHSADDLETVQIFNAKGEQVTLGQYLRDLGVQLKQVDEKGIPSFMKGFDAPESFLSPKTVPATHKVTREEKFSTPELLKWSMDNQGAFDAEDFARLRGAKSRDEFAKILTEIKQATQVTEFKSLQDFLTALEKGAISGKAANTILTQLGVKNAAELKAKIANILKKVEPKKVDIPLKQGTPTVPPKVNRILGPLDPDDFGAPAHVTKAEDIIDNGMSVSWTLPKLDETQLEDLAKALPVGVIDNLVDPNDIAKYPFLTDIKRSKRTSARMGEGRARNLHGWNAYSQSDIFRSVVRSASTRYPVPRGLKGKEAGKAFRQRSAQLYDHVLPILRAAETALRRENVKLISGKDNQGLMLSLMDVLDSLPRELVERHLFNPRTSALPTEFIDAADGVVRSLMGQVGMDLARENAFNIFKTSSKIKTLKTSDRIAGDLTQALLNNSDVLLQRVEANYARHGIEVGKSVKSMTDDVIQNVVGKYANPNVSIGETLSDFAMRAEDISANGKKIKAPTEAYTAAQNAADVTFATVLRPGDFAEARSTRNYAKATNEKEAAKIGREQAASRGAEGLDGIAPTVDLGDRFQAQFQANLFRANVPLLDKAYAMKDALGRAFVASYGHRDLHEALRVERSVTQDFSRMHRGLIAQLHDSIQAVAGPNARAHTQEAFRHLQHGTSPADPQMLATMRGLQSSIDLTFGSGINGLGSFAQRNGIFAGHLNEILDYYKAPKMLRFDPQKPIAEQAQEWKLWEDVDDPLNTLDIMHAAMQRASVEVTLGRDFSHQFGRSSHSPGYVKIKNSGGRSKVARFIDQDLYYPREIADQLGALDDVLKGSLGRIQNPNAAEVVRVYDSIIHAWKSGLTIYRPGHHVRNLIGDVTLSFFDGVTNPAVYYTATRILSRRSKAYQGWDGLKALETGTPLQGASDAGATTVKIGGKRQKFTDDQIWRAAFDQGIIPDYRTLEDIAFNAEQSQKFGIGKKVSPTRPFGGRVQKVAGGVSQARDHMVRIAHFVDVLQKGKYKTAEEAFNAAGLRVRKWHPDGSDLTNFENKVMRRTFMFYSWMRKALPLVVETLVMKPGKAMIFPKTMYAFAEANGVDLDSLGNPFPVDQLFPEFLTDQVIGPQFGEAGDYGGINPGEPVTEMMSHWGSSDPQHGLGGALSPIGRVPIELYTGTNMGTGSQILDKSDYADSQIPGLGNIARTTGRSPTSLFTDETKDVQRGNTEGGFNPRALINDLTGLGIRDYSKPNYIRRAQLEQREMIRRLLEQQNG